MTSLEKWICGLLLLGALCDGRSVKETYADKEPIYLEEFFDSTFASKSWNATWLSGSTLLYKNDGDFYKLDVKTKTPTKIFEGSILTGYEGASITVSEDELFVLIRYNVISVFRHSTTAMFTVYDIEKKTYHDLHEKKHLQLAMFDPVGHSIAYVFENNIYYLSTFPGSVIQITDSGESGIIYCGVPDWVYEEEVLGTGSALWFSPNGRKLAYATFDDRDMRDFAYSIYGEPGSLKDQYPTEAVIKYPKVGEKNPVVTVNIFDFNSMGTKSVQLPPEAAANVNDYVLYGITWPTNLEIVMISTNRVQNESKMIRCGTTCVVVSTFREANGWLDPVIPMFSKDGKKWLQIRPQPEGSDQFDHLVLTGEDGVEKRLTKGYRVVDKIFAWDEEKSLIYYGGSLEDNPAQQHVYVVNIIDGSDKCITCDFKVSGENCKYASASFCKDNSYFAKVCQGPGPAYIEIQSTTNAADLLVWEDNAELVEKLSKKSLPVIKNIRVSLPNNFEARVRLLLPPGLDEASPKKYPAIVNVYAGPNSNIVSDAYSAGFQNYIVTSREYIYIWIDGRGTGRDGKNKMFTLYRKLNSVEIEDQIAITKYLQESYPYIDANSTGIWGWSYGGFSSVWSLARDTENVFKFGLSVAPVTSFIYYDTIYTERYMGLPTETDNLAGYNNTDITRNVEKLRGKNYMLIHGTGDDNVHYQQAMVLAKALELADIPFRQQSYPDENHSLGHVSKHLYHTIDQFWAQSIEKCSKAAIMKNEV